MVNIMNSEDKPHILLFFFIALFPTSSFASNMGTPGGWLLISLLFSIVYSSFIYLVCAAVFLNQHNANDPTTAAYAAPLIILIVSFFLLVSGPLGGGVIVLGYIIGCSIPSFFYFKFANNKTKTGKT